MVIFHSELLNNQIVIRFDMFEPLLSDHGSITSGLAASLRGPHVLPRRSRLALWHGPFGLSSAGPFFVVHNFRMGFPWISIDEIGRSAHSAHASMSDIANEFEIWFELVDYET